MFHRSSVNSDVTAISLKRGLEVCTTPCLEEPVFHRSSVNSDVTAISLKRGLKYVQPHVMKNQCSIEAL